MKREAKKKHKGTRRKRQKRGREEDGILRIKWGRFIATLGAASNLKYGLIFLFSAAIINLVGVLSIIKEGLGDTHWVLVVVTFACLLGVCMAGIIVIIRTAVRLKFGE